METTMGGDWIISNREQRKESMKEKGKPLGKGRGRMHKDVTTAAKQYP